MVRYVDPLAIWSGMTDEEKIIVTEWVSENSYCIQVEESKTSIKMNIDRYDDLSVDFGEVIESKDRVKWICDCGDSFPEFHPMMDHILQTHIRSILNQD